MKIIIATHNKDKLKELHHSLKDLDLELLSLEEYKNVGEIILKTFICCWRKTLFKCYSP